MSLIFAKVRPYSVRHLFDESFPFFMKFHQLPVGHPFEYQGLRYIKSEPLRATQPETGEVKLFPRSALVVPLQHGAGEAAPAQTKSAGLKAGQVREAMASYHLAAIDLLATLLSGEAREAERLGAIEELERAYRRSLQQLSL